MKKINWYSGLMKKLFLFALALVIFFPNNTLAHDALSQSVTQLNENTFLFQITYRLNYLTYDTFAPILANQVSQVVTTSPYLQYSFVDEEGEKVSGLNGTAIILSEAEILDKQYYFADRNSSNFTLLSIVQLSPEMLISGGSLAMQVDWLPFTLSKDGKKQTVRPNTTDLKKYKTAFATWKRSRK